MSVGDKHGHVVHHGHAHCGEVSLLALATGEDGRREGGKRETGEQGNRETGLKRLGLLLRGTFWIS